MAIWEWALEAYARPGVPEQCLRLQDEFGQNTPLLLWAVWAEAADPALMARAADLARRWQDAAILPLRAARRALKPALPLVEDAAREGLREEVKAAELRAERVLLEALEALSGDELRGAHALDALKAASAAWNPAAPDAELAALAAALG
ncbi:TIGR02444 family protein [Phenylobacterium soli]|uniref:TIGR02444 family protein n=1 Tax=Phenylobacterium soli TaxID=2170551 RepID=A0A328AG83_9CAUL|nr:TIGR02444 family protein [Phenylobacterium soli]RAK53762.1 TIGR02444 family protein [Phenylobacterium soli]